MWTWPNGSTLKFRHAEDDDSWMEYQGHQYTWMGFDELPHWANPKFFRELKTRLRSAHGVPNMRIRATGNPGGKGHGWIKQHWQIDKYPLGSVLIPKDKQGGARMFVRSRVQDNKILLANDPEYIDRLQSLGSETLVMQYLEGDWNVIAGAFFTEFSVNKHVVRPFAIPKDWLRFCAMDWGSSTPFCVLWFAVSDGSPVTEDGTAKGKIVAHLPRGAIVAYREWYGADQTAGKFNIGLKMTAEEVAHGIKEREGLGENIGLRVLDPSAFKEDSGPSIAERMARTGVDFQRADNTRKGGWDQVRARLKGDDDVPMIYFFTTCPDTIRTLPMLQHDTGKKAGAYEDVDTDSEDHCFAEGTLVATPTGSAPIEQMPATGSVYTRFGVKDYRSAGLIGVQETLKLSFSDGSSVICTPDHRFLSEGTWTEARFLKGRWLHRSSLRITVKSFLACVTTAVGFIFSAKAEGFTAPYGNTMPAKSQTDFMSITPTKIEATTTPRICACSRQCGTCRCTGISKIKTNFDADSKKSRSLKPQSGIGLMKVGPGTRKMLPRMTAVGQKFNSFAKSVAALIKRGKAVVSSLSSALRTASSVRCVGVEPQPKQPVYCITVPTTAEFLLSNGLVTSNCGDTVRYGVMSRPWVPKSQMVVQPQMVKGVLTTSTTFNDLLEARRRARRENE